MIVSTTTALALRCPSCGKIRYRGLSLFAFAAQSSVSLECDCGQSLMTVSTRDRKTYYLQLECMMCEGKHLFQHKLKSLWSPGLHSLSCEETGLEVGYFGPRQLVKQAVAEQERSLSAAAEDPAYNDCFDNPEVMYQTLERLHQIADQGSLSCQCGNQQLEVEIFADRVEIRCPCCGAAGVINAASSEDLERFSNIWEITLKPGNDGLGRVGRRRRKSKRERS